MSVRILHGDCRDVLRTLPDASVDSVVTDPPYELGFMGKKWDRTGVANDVRVWAECLRVLKPGGHLVAFGGTRTYHRMVCAIEDAGLEVRDQLGWLYGSGFPKSLDVSKAIDKMDATEVRRDRQLRFTEWMRSTGLTAARIDDITGTNMGGHYTTAASQPAVATREHFDKLRPFMRCDVPPWVEAMVDERTVESENFKRRELLGVEVRFNEPSGIVSAGRDERKLIERNLTAPATDAARQWQGWGTALKPAWEPIVLARKPLVGTVAENVLQHGTGAMNIDGCRVAATDGYVENSVTQGINTARTSYEHRRERRTFEPQPAGRWPANIVHDGSEEVVALFPNTAPAKAAHRGEGKGETGCFGVFGGESTVRGHNDEGGSAARFFYCAKADRADRNDGTYDLRPRFAPTMGNGIGGKEHDPNTATKKGNHHPTVKPTDLMRWLCRLITPPGGIVLDPFMGSGSTLKAAELEGFSAIGIELEAEYIEIARRRIAADAPLFAEVAA